MEPFIFKGSESNLPEWIQKLIDDGQAFILDAEHDVELTIFDGQGYPHHFVDGDAVTMPSILTGESFPD